MGNAECSVLAAMRMAYTRLSKIDPAPLNELTALSSAIEQMEKVEPVSIPEDSYSSGVRFDLPDQHVLEVVVEPDYWERGHFVQGTRPHINWFQIQKLPIGTKLYTAPVATEHKELEAAIERRLLREERLGLRSPVAPVKQEPVAWMFDLATLCSQDGKYSNWENRIQRFKPTVPANAIRNSIPLFATPVAPSNYEAYKEHKRKKLEKAGFLKSPLRENTAPVAPEGWQAVWIEKAKAYLEAQCDDKCNAEYNPCEAKELLKELP